MKDAADAKGVALSKDESREAVYGMPYEEWKAKHQKEASPAQAGCVREKPQALTRSAQLRSVKQNRSAIAETAANAPDETVHGCG